MPFAPDTELVVERVDATSWRLQRPLVYHGRDHDVTVPAGYVTDFASVPRSLQWLAPATGSYTLAAVLHDWLCDHVADGRVAFWRPECQVADIPGITARDVDGLFRRVMREQRVRPLQRWLLWAGVRVGAIRNPDRRPGTLRDVPALLGTALLAAPFVLPVLALIWVARFAYEIAEGLAGWFAEPFTTEENTE